MIIYTSGTTGRPKGTVHTHCGFPIKAAQDMAHCMDVHDVDTMFWVTDMGWMMGPWEVFGMTLLGGTMVLYDGALDYPGPDRLWALVERHGVSVLGVSPTLIRALMRHGDAPVRAHEPVDAAHPGLDRGTVESGIVAMAVRDGRGRPHPDHQLFGRYGNLWRSRRRAMC